MRTAAVKRQCCGSTAQPGAGAPTDSRPRACFLPLPVQLGCGIRVLGEPHGRSVADGPRVDEPVARLRALHAAAALAYHADAVARRDEVLDLEVEALPDRAEPLEETGHLVLAVQMTALREHLGDV